MRRAVAIVSLVLAAACGETTNGDDAGTDASIDVFRADANAVDAISDVTGDSTNACDPSLPDTYVPTWIPPNMPSNACTKGQIQALYDACVNHAGSAACNTFESNASNAACTACMESPLGASSYGPFLVWRGGSALEANVAGCMALVDGDLSANGCGAKYEAWQDCFIAACDTCPAGTFVSCSTPAQNGVCGAYRAAAMSCYGQGRYDPCRQTTFETYFTAYGAMFCAAAGSDASAD